MKKSLPYLLVIAALVGLSVFLFVRPAGRVQELSQQVTDLQEVQKELAADREVLLKLNDFDLRLLEGEDCSAILTDLEDFTQPAQASPAVAALITQRKEYLASLVRERDRGDRIDDQKDRRIRALGLELSALRTTADTIYKAYQVDLKAKEETLGKLRGETNQLRAALEQKERVKVLSFKSPQGVLIHYLGEVENGKANGGGVGIWSTGSLYRGDWKDNKRHGMGRFEWVDGERYEGDYVNGTREGEGSYFWPSGERYEGEWSADQRNGEGVLYDMDGNIEYQGLWKNDLPTH